MPTYRISATASKIISKCTPLDRVQFILKVNDRHALDACVTNLVIHLIIDISCYHIKYGAS